MANIQGTVKGLTISLKNDTSGDIYPYRCVTKKAQGTCQYPSATGKDFLGVTLKNLNYESGVTPDQDPVSIQIDGVVDIDANGPISVGDYVKVSSTAGKVESAAVMDGMSNTGSGGFTPVVGIALESAVSGGRIAVLLRPNLA